MRKGVDKSPCKIAVRYRVSEQYVREILAMSEAELEAERYNAVRRERLRRLSAVAYRRGYSARQIQPFWMPWGSTLGVPSTATIMRMARSAAKEMGWRVMGSKDKVRHNIGNADAAERNRAKALDARRVAWTFVRWDSVFPPQQVVSGAEVHQGLDYDAIVYQRPPPGKVTSGP